MILDGEVLDLKPKMAMQWPFVRHLHSPKKWWLHPEKDEIFLTAWEKDIKIGIVNARGTTFA